MELRARISDGLRSSQATSTIRRPHSEAMHQAATAREHAFPTGMVLPQRLSVATSGVATGLRRIAETRAAALRKLNDEAA